MSDVLAGDAKFGVRVDEVAAGMHDLGPGDLLLQAPEPRRAPASEESAVAHLSDRLERDELDATNQEWS